MRIFDFVVYLAFWVLTVALLLWAVTLIIDSVAFSWVFVGVISVLGALITERHHFVQQTNEDAKRYMNSLPR